MSGFRFQVSGLRVQGLGFRFKVSGFRVQGSGFRVQGSGFRVQISRFRFQGSGFRDRYTCIGVQGPQPLPSSLALDGSCRFCEMRGCRQVPQPPPCHGKRLGKAVDNRQERSIRITGNMYRVERVMFRVWGRSRVMGFEFQDQGYRA